jgi:enoyl-CoA hydratase/carnithine racemase
MSAVTTEVRAGALWVRLERPEAMNSLNWDVVAGLDAALDEALAADGVHALVVIGSGRAFCAGADLEMLGGAASGDGPESEDGSFERFLAAVYETFRRLERLPLPTIAAINGIALAGGTSRSPPPEPRSATRTPTSASCRGAVGRCGWRGGSARRSPSS